MRSYTETIILDSGDESGDGADSGAGGMFTTTGVKQEGVDESRSGDGDAENGVHTRAHETADNTSLPAVNDGAPVADTPTSDTPTNRDDKAGGGGQSRAHETADNADTVTVSSASMPAANSDTPPPDTPPPPELSTSTHTTEDATDQVADSQVIVRGV